MLKPICNYILAVWLRNGNIKTPLSNLQRSMGLESVINFINH